MTVFQLTEEILFPAVSSAEDNGLLAIGGDLSNGRLLAAYALGIFPWYSGQEPILWWSPDPRLVLFPEHFIISGSLQRKIDHDYFEVRFDTNFEEVIGHCASVERKHEAGTWITPEMKTAYIELHRNGFAHSVETYYKDKLSGGLYGISLGRAFFGESMFHLVPDASKAALFHLVEKAKEFDFSFIDAQVETTHMISMGAELIPRVDYMKLLNDAMRYPSRIGKWKKSEVGGQKSED